MLPMSRPGVSAQVLSSHVKSRNGGSRQSRRVTAGSGVSWPGGSRQSRRGESGLVSAGRGRQVTVRPVTVWRSCHGEFRAAPAALLIDITSVNVLIAIMKIALFYPHNFLASHYALFSYRETLESMGHHVLDCPFPGNQVQNVDAVRRVLPSIEHLNHCDVVLSTFHEYVQPWLRAVYADAWFSLKVPVIARFDESMDRADLGLPLRMPELLKWAKYYSFPAAQTRRSMAGNGCRLAQTLATSTLRRCGR